MGPAAFSNCNHYPARVLRISVLSTTRMATVVVHVCRPDRAWPPCCDRRRCHHVRLHARKLSWLDRTSRGSRDPGDHTRRYVWRDKACAIKGCFCQAPREISGSRNLVTEPRVYTGLFHGARDTFSDTSANS